jgi:hypothetical protein
MEMEVKITKTLIANGRNFKIGDDVHFYLLRNGKEYNCFGIITDIKESEFYIEDVEIDKMNVSDTLVIKYTEVKDGKLSYTDNGAY